MHIYLQFRTKANGDKNINKIIHEHACFIYVLVSQGCMVHIMTMVYQAQSDKRGGNTLKTINKKLKGSNITAFIRKAETVSATQHVVKPVNIDNDLSYFILSGLLELPKFEQVLLARAQQVFSMKFYSHQVNLLRLHFLHQMVSK